MQRFARTCEKTHGFTCTITPDRGRLNESDALIFNDWELSTADLPLSNPASKELGWPKWVYFQTESPLHTKDHLKNFSNTFHWTMTYRRGSDISYDYGTFALKESSQVRQDDLPRNNGSKLVAWMASACSRPSMRGEIVTELQTFLPIDIYGACGPLTLNCSRGTEVNCYDLLARDYKFFLAFENSVCDDYVTEKAWDALKAGMVPIVYGGADYATHLPPRSFIDITTFNTLKEVADYVLYLEETPAEYSKYFEWRKRYAILATDEFWSSAFCELCGRLLEERGIGSFDNSVIPDLDHFWNGYTGKKKTAPEFLIKHLQHINNPKVPTCNLFEASDSVRRSAPQGITSLVNILSVLSFCMYTIA